MRIEAREHDPISPPPHAGGAVLPTLDKVPRHVAIVMDGNGRWANAKGLPRTEGHKQGEISLMDVIAGCIEAGVEVLSVYAFSTENWKRSPREVTFLMNYSRDVIHNRRHELDSWGVKIVWSGRVGRLWSSVIKELKEAERLTRLNNTLTFNFCCNYGGRAEIADATRAIAEDVAAGLLEPRTIDEKLISRYMYQPDLPDVDLFIRTGGEQRTSNFLLWESSYAEYMFATEPWPEFDRAVFWHYLEGFANRERRFGGATDAVAGA